MKVLANPCFQMFVAEFLPLVAFLKFTIGLCLAAELWGPKHPDLDPHAEADSRQDQCPEHRYISSLMDCLEEQVGLMFLTFRLKGEDKRGLMQMADTLEERHIRIPCLKLPYVTMHYMQS